MAIVIKKSYTGSVPVGNGSVIIKKSVHTPNFSANDWYINPDLSAVDGLDRKYWKIVADAILPMTIDEKESVDSNMVINSMLQGSKYECYSESFSTSTTTSSSYQTKVSLSTPSLELGVKYKLSWYCEIGADPFNEITVQVQLNDNDIAETNFYQPNSTAGTDNYRPFSGYLYYTTLSGINSLIIQYKDSYFNNKTVRIRKAHILVETV